MAALAVVMALAVGVASMWLAADAQPPEIDAPEPELPLAERPAVPAGFAYIHAGAFTMGSPPGEVKREAWNDDEALHRVNLLRSFMVQKTEVTQAEWLAVFRKADPAFKGRFRFHKCGPTCPAETLSWFEAVAYANLYSKQNGGLEPCYHTPEGAPYGWEHAQSETAVVWTQGLACEGYRLPTESEWEYAARGRGAFRSRANYAGSTRPAALGSIAWYVDNSEAVDHGIDCSKWDWKDNDRVTICGPQPVAGKAANSNALHDMIGNVWEWTWDRYGAYPASQVSDPVGPDTGDHRVVRGCSWYIHPSGCRAAKRSDHEPGLRNGNLGFRLARTVPAK